MEDLENNLSTIAVIIYGVLSPYLAQYLSTEQFSALFIAIISIVLAVYSAKHPNTFKALGNAEEDEGAETEEDLINQDYYEEI
jgi:hypothetical protein